MLIGTVWTDGGQAAAILAPDGRTASLLDVADRRDPVLALLRDPRGLTQAVDDAMTSASVAVDSLPLAAPVRRPGKVVAVGLNYPDHTAETGFVAPERPLTFAKYPSSVVGPYADIVVPWHLTRQLDYEAELAVVIGRECPPSGAASLADIAGFCVANDVSARDVQFGDGQWTRAKSFDTFTPMGPWLVTPDEVPDVQTARIWATVNGELRQDDNVASMVFDLASILAFVSDGVSLEAGDVILTGTPAGAGAFLEPPRALSPGDVVEVGVDGVGALRNLVSTQARQ
jgi:2-keto-4-pentenoate hydratase/2-oxohepta-3-ene-1,7-dioic acid hydratase in catechol pathway